MAAVVTVAGLCRLFTGLALFNPEPDPVFGPRRRSTKRFREHLGREALHQTVRHVVWKEGVGESLVRRSVTGLARRLLGAPGKPRGATVLGMDEFSLRKGQVYDTAIMDIEGKGVLGVVIGHRREEVATGRAGTLGSLGKGARPASFRGPPTHAAALAPGDPQLLRPPYSNGFLEGKNNRIKVIKRIAYGYRNGHNFRQRILLTNLREAHPRAA